MRAKDKCPSCFQPVLPTDFMCANCELIIDASQALERPAGDLSVVRRMLEAPQRGLPSTAPNRRPRSSPTDGLEGPTRKLDLGPELSGVPVVVATLTGKSHQLSEFEAWVISLIDGLSDANSLAKTTGVREFELRVVLRTLQEKRIIDFADEPLSDADLEMPAVMGTLDQERDEQERPSGPSLGANVDRRDGRFVAPPARADAPPGIPAVPGVVPPAPPHAPTAAQRFDDTNPGERVPTGRRGPVIHAGRAAVPPPPSSDPKVAEREPPAIVQRKAESSMRAPSPGQALAYPGANPEEKRGLPPTPAASSRPPAPPPPRPERTDPRIVYSGNVNRKVLDALKKVKRTDAPATPTASVPKEEPPSSLEDVLARDTLQVALRMEQSGRLDEAIRFLERSISRSPDAASLYNRLGIILMRERADYRRAETLIRKATELAPLNTVYSTNLQQVLSQQASRAHR